ncbi:MAG: outer membrane PBP1 activator LpoA protein [Pseudomonadales bacterium]|jgi:outer membrane PBP1 activator LpoA protein
MENPYLKMTKINPAPAKINLVRNILLACFIAGLAACGGQTKPTPDNPIDATKAQDSINKLILTAQNSFEPIRSSKFLQAAELSAQITDLTIANSLIQQVDSSELNNDQLSLYGSIYSNVYITLKQPNLALDWLEANTLITLNNPQLLQLQAQAYNDVLLPIEAAKILTSLLALTTDEENILKYSEQLWDILIQTASTRLNKAISTEAENSDFSGWLSIALIAKDTSITLAQTQQKILFWQSAWSEHAANIMRPSSLMQLISLTAPEKIAILIPLSGRLRSAGDSIRDGIIAAHLADEENQNTELQFFDTNRNKDIAQLYRQAIDSGASSVIGPLTKSNLEQLEKNASIDIQTLALNFTDNILNNSNLSKLGLSANDDALLASKQALNADLDRALVIQSDKDWSIRAAKSFIDNWKQNEASVAIRTTFTDNATMSNTIKNALNLQHSEERTKYLQDVLGEFVESDPYRRKDIDMVFIATNSQEARSLKPILAFHFAGDLPVYATSQINNGENAQSKDMDLSGIYFGETPWAIAGDDRFNSEITNHISRGGSYSKNLYALGMDAYYISQRMSLLNANNNYKLQGFTGALSRLSNGNIEREPSWASFSNGLISAEETTYMTLRKEANNVMATTTSLEQE